MKILKTKKLFTYVVVGALVMALSISCDNEGETGGGGNGGTGGSSGGSQSKSELVGTWRAKEGGALAPSFTVNDEGNIMRKYGYTTANGFENVNYTGKVADTFDYHYTVELVGTIVKLDGTDTGETKKGTCIFNSASECILTIEAYNPLERPESRWYDLTETYYKQ